MSSVELQEVSWPSRWHFFALWQWVVLMYWQYPVSNAAKEAEVQEKTAIQVYQYLRDICSWYLMSMDAPLLLGGPGVIVQIDESLFRHKPKVSEYNSEHKVLGLICNAF